MALPTYIRPFSLAAVTIALAATGVQNRLPLTNGILGKPFSAASNQLAPPVYNLAASLPNRLPLTNQTVAPKPFANQNAQLAPPIYGIQAQQKAVQYGLAGVNPPPKPFTNLNAALANITLPLSVAPANKVPATSAAAAPFTPTPTTLAPITLTLGAQSVSLPFGLNGVVTPTTPFTASNQTRLAPPILPLAVAAYNPTLIDVAIRQFLLLTTKAQAQISTAIAPIQQASGANFALQNTTTTTPAPFANALAQLAPSILPLSQATNSPTLINVSIRQFLLLTTKPQVQPSPPVPVLQANTSANYALQNTPVTPAPPFASSSTQLAPTIATLNATQSNYALKNTPVNTTQPFASANAILAPVTYTLQSQQVSLLFGLNGIVSPPVIIGGGDSEDHGRWWRSPKRRNLAKPEIITAHQVQEFAAPAPPVRASISQITLMLARALQPPPEALLPPSAAKALSDKFAAQPRPDIEALHRQLEIEISAQRRAIAEDDAIIILAMSI